MKQLKLNTFKADVSRETKIMVLEQAVADHYELNAAELHTFLDTKEKLVLCFLVYHFTNLKAYSIGSRYRINSGFLSNKVIELYVKAFDDKDFYNELMSIIERAATVINSEVKL